MNEEKSRYAENTKKSNIGQIQNNNLWEEKNTKLLQKYIFEM